MSKRTVTGHRVGQSHHRAKLTDDQVKAIRNLHSQGGKGYGAIAREFGCGESTVRDIVTYRTRFAV